MQNKACRNKNITEIQAENFVFRLASENGRAIVSISLLLCVSSAALLANPLLAGQLTSSIVSGETSKANITLSAWCFLLVVQAFLTYFSFLAVAKVRESVSANLKKQVFRKTMFSPPDSLTGIDTGKLISIVLNDTETLARFIVDSCCSILPQFITIVVSISILLWIDISFGGLVFSSVLVFLIVFKLLSRKVRDYSESMLVAHAELVGTSKESFDTRLLIKTFNYEKTKTHEFEGILNRYMEGAVRLEKFVQLYGPLTQLCGGVLLLLILGIFIQGASGGRLELPELVTAFFYGLLLVRPVSNLSGLAGSYINASASARRSQTVLKMVEEWTPENPVASEQRRFSNGDIRFENVSFSYPGRRKLFSGLSFEIRQGEILALIGDNGEGKSTIASLLSKLQVPTEGFITINSININLLYPGELRRNVCYVQQEMYFFNDTIHANLLLNRKSTECNLVKMLDVVGAADFIRSLPKGLNTVVGENGIQLSGGQRQKLSLVRAALGEPPIVILDEVTSMFDPDSEYRYLNRIRDIFTNSTIILITQRPASLEIADRVLQLQSGEIVMKRDAE